MSHGPHKLRITHTHIHHSGVCKLPGCAKPRFFDEHTRHVHDLCGRTHATEYKETVQTPKRGHLVQNLTNRRAPKELHGENRAVGKRLAEGTPVVRAPGKVKSKKKSGSDNAATKKPVSVGHPVSPPAGNVHQPEELEMASGLENNMTIEHELADTMKKQLKISALIGQSGELKKDFGSSTDDERQLAKIPSDPPVDKLVDVDDFMDIDSPLPSFPSHLLTDASPLVVTPLLGSDDGKKEGMQSEPPHGVPEDVQQTEQLNDGQQSVCFSPLVASPLSEPRHEIPGTHSGHQSTS